ncbi:MAG: M67 family metallopeptidase, partial [Candidatus Angelobacter sp.]
MLTIDQKEYDEIRQHGQDAYPLMSCGILVGRSENFNRVVTSIVHCKNVADSPRNRFRVAPEDVIRTLKEARQREEQIVGFYYSDCDHPPQWSKITLEESHWFDCSYIIASVI